MGGYSSEYSENDDGMVVKVMTIIVMVMTVIYMMMIIIVTAVLVATLQNTVRPSIIREDIFTYQHIRINLPHKVLFRKIYLPPHYLGMQQTSSGSRRLQSSKATRLGKMIIFQRIPGTRLSPSCVFNLMEHIPCRYENILFKGENVLTPKTLQQVGASKSRTSFKI